MTPLIIPTGASRRWRLLGTAVSVCLASSLFAQTGGFPAEEPSSRPWRVPIYFPPIPPLLGAPIPLPAFGAPRRATPAPPELAEYVNEVFYAPLSTRLDQKKLSVRQEEKLRSYRAAKVALQNELQERLEQLREADGATREQALADLAQVQTPRIARLEQQAEELRYELVHGEFFQRNVDWNAIRGWRLGDGHFVGENDAIAAQYQVMLASAFYQNGLLPEQRGLLREIALEFLITPRRVSDEDAKVARNPPLFFSPAMSRLLLPPEIPAFLGEKIAAFEREKSGLKAELRQTVYAQDRAFFERTRNRALENLAETQWPRISALERLAEEIRRDLAALPNPPGPPAPPSLPAALSSHITQFITEKNQLSSELIRRLDELKRRYPFIQIQPSRNPTGGTDLKLALNSRGESDETLKALRIALDALNLDVSTRQGELRKKQEALRREFAAVVPADDPRSIETVLDTYSDIIQQREDWSLYGAYEVAVLTPGLSPEQRRLLFDRGLEKLELPLPRWEQIYINVVY